jgi:hypothetical protein
MNTDNFYKDTQKKPYMLSYRCRWCLREEKARYHLSVRDINKEKRRLKRIASAPDEETIKRKIEESKRKARISKQEYREKNRCIINEKQKIKYKNGLIKKPSKESVRMYKKTEYEKFKKRPYHKFVHYSRIRLNKVLKGEIDCFSVNDVLLFDRDSFIRHIESNFKDGMSWDNYGRGGWHIDHIKPLAAFDFSENDWLKKAFSLENLQPLFESENLSKGSFYNGKRHTFGKSTKK